MLKSDAGRRAFLRAQGAKRLLPLLCSPSDIVSNAVSSLLARASAQSATLCASMLFNGGARLLCGMAAGIEEGGESYAKRCITAELLHFCVSRLKLTPGRVDDEAFLDALPGLMDLLRMSTIPLFIPINTATKLSHPVRTAASRAAPPTTPTPSSVPIPMLCGPFLFPSSSCSDYPVL